MCMCVFVCMLCVDGCNGYIDGWMDGLMDGAFYGEQLHTTQTPTAVCVHTDVLRTCLQSTCTLRVVHAHSARACILISLYDFRHELAGVRCQFVCDVPAGLVDFTWPCRGLMEGGWRDAADLSASRRGKPAADQPLTSLFIEQDGRGRP